MFLRVALIILAGGLVYQFAAKPAYIYLSDEISWARCDSLEGVPDYQQEFVSAVCNTLNQLRLTESDLRKEDLEDALDKKLCQLVDGRPTKNWRGTIQSIDETLVMNSVVLSIELSSKIRLSTDSGVFASPEESDEEILKSDVSEAELLDEETSDTGLFGIQTPQIVESVIGGEFPDLNPLRSTHIAKDHPVYDKLKKLDVGEKVFFSGSFVSRAESKDCVKHANTYDPAKLWSRTDAADYWFDFSDIEPL